MIKLTARLLKILNSETNPSQISLAVCFALVAGFTPLINLHNVFVLFLVLVLRVNLSAFLLGLAVFSGMAYMLDPLFNNIGLGLLTAGSLKGIWTSMYNSPFWRVEKFNNSIVMGSLVCTAILFLPLLVASNVLIRKYREHVLAWVQRSHIMQVIKATKFYNVYRSISGLRSGS